jgi:hypothetical protein
MADKEHLATLRAGVVAWNMWRRENPNISPDLCRARLSGADLHEANLRYANFSGADLHWAALRRADLSGANFQGANFSGADLRWANLRWANFSGADFRAAELSGANLREANFGKADLGAASLGETDLYGADFQGANLNGGVLYGTSFSDTNLAGVKGLDTCHHAGRSSIDLLTLNKSGQLPLAFLRGIGLPDNFIDHLPSLLNTSAQFHSCFISYSGKDEDFARRLHADLQAKGVRCWFAPEDMRIGDRIRDRIDEVICIHERLLLVLSKHSITSRWVEKEVETAFEQEQKGKGTALFPVRLDDAVLVCDRGWAADIRRTRHIGDFRQWKRRDAYRKALGRLLRDLTYGRGDGPWPARPVR